VVISSAISCVYVASYGHYTAQYINSYTPWTLLRYIHTHLFFKLHLSIAYFFLYFLYFFLYSILLLTLKLSRFIHQFHKSTFSLFVQTKANKAESLSLISDVVHSGALTRTPCRPGEPSVENVVVRPPAPAPHSGPGSCAAASSAKQINSFRSPRLAWNNLLCGAATF